jgi:type IV secretion system protein VirB10
MIGCAVAALFIAGSTIVALRPPRAFNGTVQMALYNTDRKQTADGVDKLPKTYADLAAPPRLGPPSPGDVGKAFAEAERKSGVSPAAAFTTNPEEDAERAERIRQMRIAEQAKESGLFVPLSEKQEKSKQATATDLPASSPPAFSRRPSIQGRRLLSWQRLHKGCSIDPAKSFPRHRRANLPLRGAKPDTETTNPHAGATGVDIRALDRLRHGALQFRDGTRDALDPLCQSFQGGRDGQPEVR